LELQVCTATSRVSSVLAVMAVLDPDGKLFNATSIQLATRTEAIPGHPNRVRAVKEVSGKWFLGATRQAVVASVRGGIALIFDDSPEAWLMPSGPNQHTEVESGRLVGTAVITMPGIGILSSPGNTDKFLAALRFLQVCVLGMA
jgi:hypothetical protein